MDIFYLGFYQRQNINVEKDKNIYLLMIYIRGNSCLFP